MKDKKMLQKMTEYVLQSALKKELRMSALRLLGMFPMNLRY